MKVCINCGCTGITRFHAYDVRDVDMFSLSRLLGSLAVIRFGSTLALLFVDLGSELFVSSRVCLVREHVCWVECLVCM